MKKKMCKYLGISMITLLLVTGCGKIPKLKNGEESVVSLKNSEISVNTLYDKIKEQYALSALIDLIDQEILDKKYKETDDLKKDIQDQIDSMIEQYGSGSEQTLLEQTWSAWGIDTMDKLKAYLILQYKRNLAVEDYAKDQITDKEINNYYDEKIFGDIKAKHILISVDTSNSSTDQEKNDAKEKALNTAKEVIEKLNNGGDFDSLAKEYSTDEATKDKGGLLSDFVHGDMESAFEEAAKKLENGKYTTTPVETSYGYHIIYKVSQKDKPKLDTVKEDIIEELSKDLINNDTTIQVKALEELRKKNKMKINDDTLENQYERYLKNAKK